MTLSNWIKEIGQANLAKKLGIEEATVSHWQNHRTLPRPKLMAEIFKISCGLVTYKEMVEDYLKNKEVKS